MTAAPIEPQWRKSCPKTLSAAPKLAERKKTQANVTKAKVPTRGQTPPPSAVRPT